MEQVVKKYTREDVTVIWKPDLCIHSKKCWTGLRTVFDPKSRPWINLDGADKELIMEQVLKCPSGALSYILEDTTVGEDNTSTEVTTTVEVLKNGPLLVYGNLQVKDGKGGEHNRSKVTAFCRCGASANKPFCDGSHIRIGFKDE